MPEISYLTWTSSLGQDPGSLVDGHDVSGACRKAGISDATYYNWRRKFGGVGHSQLSEMRALEKEC
ncbi:MAG: transposase, partial [Pseudomonadota bacterium]